MGDGGNSEGPWLVNPEFPGEEEERRNAYPTAIPSRRIQ
jgi:hypothetical protein